MEEYAKFIIDVLFMNIALPTYKTHNYYMNIYNNSIWLG